MARDIAGLINSFNRLTVKHSIDSIRNSTTTYFTEICLKFVIGCVGLSTEPGGSRIKHLCVHPSFRNSGVARRLVQSAIDHSETPTVFMTIRDDNFPCLQLAKSMGFEIWKKTWHIDHFVYVVGRSTDAKVCFNRASQAA